MLNEQIKRLRESTGMTQVDLAKKLSVNKQAVSNWENDNIQPSIEMLLKLADCFGVSTDYLLCRTEQKTLRVDGLTEQQIQHLNSIVKDLQK